MTLFSRGNFEVKRAAASKGVLRVVRVEQDGTTAATNGRIMVVVGPVNEDKVVFPNVGDVGFLPSNGVSVDLDLVEDVLKNMPKSAELQYAQVTKARTAGKVEFTTSDMKREHRVAGLPAPGGFPDWREVLRKTGGNGVKICFNRNDLMQALETLQDACPDKGEEVPIFLEFNQAMTGVIMRVQNRGSGQRAIAGLRAYDTGGQWLPKDTWESRIFGIVRKLLKPILK